VAVCLVKVEVLMIFIDGIIGQMRKVILHVGPTWGLPFLGGKSSYPLLIEINPQRRHTRNKDVNSHIKLKLVNQQGSLHVFLYNKAALFIDLVGVIDDEDSFALTVILGLQDIELTLLMLL
jgi:hypothetical protein